MFRRIKKKFVAVSFQICVNIIGLPVYHTINPPVILKTIKSKFHK